MCSEPRLDPTEILVRRLWFTLMFSTARLLLTAHNADRSRHARLLRIGQDLGVATTDVGTTRNKRADVYELVMEIVDGLIEAGFNVVADASEADNGVLDFQYQHTDPLTAAKLEHTVFVATDRQVDPGAIIKAIRSFK